MDPDFAVRLAAIEHLHALGRRFDDLIPRRELLELLALGLAAGAQASSIVYIKRGHVWLAKSDGTGQRALTRNGTPSNPYRSPAYSDAGVITAVRGRRDIYFFNRRGRQLRRKRDLSAGPHPRSTR